MSTAEQFAKNFSMGSFAKATELKQRIWFTLGALVVFRIGAHIPLPGIDAAALAVLFQRQSGGILGIFDVFSGGALGRMTIFALSIMPYISASIIMQLMTAVMPTLEAMKKERGEGYKKINQYTRQLTVLLAVVQGYAIAVGLESAGDGVVVEPGFLFRFTAVISLTAGTMFLMWLGEQITQRGVGQGASLIIFTGIVANLPLALVQVLELGRTGALSTFLILLLMVFSLAVVAFIVFVERAQRRIIVNYPKRQVGLTRMTGGEASHIPIKINVSGVIPPIFASSLLLLPATILGFFGQSGGGEWLQILNTMLGRGGSLHLVFYAGMIIFFAFFYTAIVFNAQETAENLRKQGGIVLGYRPGQPTADYFDYVLTRLTVVGSIYLVLICIIPEILISQYAVPFYFGGTSLLIVVSVTMDTITQIQGHMFAHQYENLIRKAKLTGGSMGGFNFPK